MQLEFENRIKDDYPDDYIPKFVQEMKEYAKLEEQIPNPIDVLE